MRTHKNWLASFLNWALPRAESPESFHLFAGLFVLSSTVRRNIFIGKKYLGGWDCYPHLYVMFVGPPGAVRKTTTMRFAGELLDKVTFLVPAPSIVTQAALLKRLVENKESSVYVFAKEFSDLVMKSEHEMYEFLTSLFDGDAKFESETISRGIEFAKDPCVNLLAATTPGWISSSMPESVIEGGFASRCIFIFEDQPRYKKMFFDDVSVPEDILSMKESLIKDLYHIGQIKGEFVLNDDAKDYMEKWYQEMKIPQGTKIASYYARKPTHVLKIAMLLHISRSDELVIELSDIKESLVILESVEKRMLEVFGGVGKNPFTADIKSILSFITDKQKVTKKEVLITYESSAPPSMLESLIDILIKTGRVLIKVEDNEVYLVPKPRTNHPKVTA